MQPPRALWVPFELGRPVGAPEDAGFQRRVVTAALGLLDAAFGPVLTDYPEDAPPDGGDGAMDEGWTCPVCFAAPEANAPDTFAAKVSAEAAQLKPWHEAWKRRKGASGIGAAGAEVEALAAFIGALADGGDPPSPVPGADMAQSLKLAVNDLMTYYQEGANAQPGATGGSKAINDWFWGQTVLGKALLRIRVQASQSDDPKLAAVAGRLVLPHVAAAYAGE